jgi:predicted dehydrogenase
MDPKKIRVGIVGATVTRGGSGWGANAHVPALQALLQYELAAVCTAHPDTAQASREAFGAQQAFSDFDAMLQSPDVDLVVVCVRVPGHYDLVMRALEADKAVLCEWPLGRTLEEAERMTSLAERKNLRTAVGLQARSDPALMYARELIQQGFVGQVESVAFTSTSQAITRRGEGRIWQGVRSNGANTFTIAGGHAIDALCFVLGDEFADVSARLATQITQWDNTDTGGTLQVDSPDWVSVSGRLSRGGEVAFLSATVRSHPGEHRFEIRGTDGALSITSNGWNQGPNTIHGARGTDVLAVMEPPQRYTLVPESVPAGSPRNVAQAYVRFADALAQGSAFEPDFAHALKRHQLLHAIETSSAEGVRQRVDYGRVALISE